MNDLAKLMLTGLTVLLIFTLAAITFVAALKGQTTTGLLSGLLALVFLYFYKRIIKSMFQS